MAEIKLYRFIVQRVSSCPCLIFLSCVLSFNMPEPGIIIFFFISCSWRTRRKKTGRRKVISQFDFINNISHRFAMFKVFSIAVDFKI